MCGIFAYHGTDDKSAEKVIRGLKDLEYRGYDSWGIVVKTAGGRRGGAAALRSAKAVGKVSDVDGGKFGRFRGRTALGHTRWATHGGVSRANAHPHFNRDKTIAVVHNGIIENHADLRRELEKRSRGRKIFKTKTDTEVIPHLIDALMRGGMPFEAAFCEAARRLSGRFAFVAVHRDRPFILAARNGSPLVVGKAEGEYYIASDTPAFLDFTNVVNFVENGEYVRAGDDGLSFYDFRTGKKVRKRDETITWNKQTASKAGWEHFMLKEILEQKETLYAALAQSARDLDEAVEHIKGAENVIFTAAGTAGHVAMCAEYYWNTLASHRTHFAFASEFHRFLPFVGARTLVIAVTQSGETADLLEAINEAKSRGAKVLSVLNARGSSVERESHFFFPINAGPEKAVASTKAATSQLAVFLLLAFALEGRRAEGEAFLKEKIQEVDAWLDKKLVDHVRRIASSIRAHDDLYVIGKSVEFPVALEIALKIKEVSYIHAEGFPAGELKHGPIALIEKGTPCVALVDRGEFERDVISSAEELSSRGAAIIGISAEKHAPFKHWIPVPHLGVASPVANMIAGQILAYHLAVLRSHDPDKPRNLAKSVTVK